MDSPQLIALLTDFGLRDPYVGVMKGVILSANPDARIIDLSHDVHPHDVASAYLLLQNSFTYFPDGTVFVATVGATRPPIAVETARHRFLAPDNGTLSFLLKQEKVRSLHLVRNRKLMLKVVSDTFPGRDIYAPVAARLAAGLDIARVGPALKKMVSLRTTEPVVERIGVIVGEVVSIDAIGNLITNIPLERLKDGERHEIRLGSQRNRELSRAKRKGALVAVPGSAGLLQITLTHGSASKEFGARVGDIIRISQTP